MPCTGSAHARCQPYRHDKPAREIGPSSACRRRTGGLINAVVAIGGRATGRTCRMVTSAERTGANRLRQAENRSLPELPSLTQFGDAHGSLC